jgi:hypothetical protein
VEISDLYVVLWSPTQNALHVESVAEMLEANAENFRCDRGSDYTVMAFASTEEAAHALETEYALLRDARDGRPSVL